MPTPDRHAEILARYHLRVREFEEIARRLPPSREPEPPAADSPRPTPTRRELEVLAEVAEGFSNREIGRRLQLAEDTIKSHVRSLAFKLRARNRAHAVAIGLRGGLLGVRRDLPGGGLPSMSGNRAPD